MRVPVDAASFFFTILGDPRFSSFLEGLYEDLRTPSTFDAEALRIPFLHIFSRQLSAEEVYIDSLYKMKYADIYRLILEKPKHHWDVATEGYVSAKFLGNRAAVSSDVIQTFHLFNRYLVWFFQANLNGNHQARALLTDNSALSGLDTNLVSMQVLPARSHSPNIAELVALIESQGTASAIQFVTEKFPSDSGSVLRNNLFSLKNIANYYQRRGAVEETLAVAAIMLLLEPGLEEVRSILDDFGYQLLAVDRFDLAKQVFLQNETHFPNHHIPAYSLGDYYLRTGQSERALEKVERSLAFLLENNELPEATKQANQAAISAKIQEARQKK